MAGNRRVRSWFRFSVKGTEHLTTARNSGEERVLAAVVYKTKEPPTSPSPISKPGGNMRQGHISALPLSYVLFGNGGIRTRDLSIMSRSNPRLHHARNKSDHLWQARADSNCDLRFRRARPCPLDDAPVVAPTPTRTGIPGLGNLRLFRLDDGASILERVVHVFAGHRHTQRLERVEHAY